MSDIELKRSLKKYIKKTLTYLIILRKYFIEIRITLKKNN